MSKNRRVKRLLPKATKQPTQPTRTERVTPGGRRDDRSREVGGILLLGTAIFVVAGLLSLQAGAGTLMGPFGRAVASLVYGAAGMCSYGVAVGAAVVAIRLLMGRTPPLRIEHVLGTALAVLSLGTLLHLAAARYRVAGHGPGGLIGENLGEVLRAILSTAGTALLAAVGLIVAVIVATPLRMRQVLGRIGAVLQSIGRGFLAAVRAIGGFVGDVVRAILPERDREEYDDEADDRSDDDDGGFAVEDSAERQFVEPPIIVHDSGRIGTGAPSAELDGDTERVDEATAAARIAELDGESGRKPRKRSKRDARTLPGVGEAIVAGLEPAVAKATPSPAPLAVVPFAVVPPVATTASGAAAGAMIGPVIVESKFKHADKATMAAKEKQVDAERLDFIPIGEGGYKLPPIHLLNFDASQQSSIDKNAMLELSARLTQTLDNYGVKGEVVAIRPGPVVTMYEFSPAPGTRLSKIVNLNDDLAMALEALRVRIVAPIPGKAAVGIEVPNRTREKVYLKEIIADDAFRLSAGKLSMALGKDIEGGPAVFDLGRMPHLLVAGTTGSGKSVAVNAMITSLLYNCTPEDVRMIMVDPKMLELSIYEGVPHLLLPVVTDPKKANLALRWAVDEMERRYDLLAQKGVRDIANYNLKLAKERAKYEADKLQHAADAARRAASGETDSSDDDSDDAVEITSERGPRQSSLSFDQAEPPRRLPFIVIVIDEFADLMMCAPKEVETSVARIAQKARACGIHLILATQRPSVDVITGLIKANFPSRIAFHVASKIDARTILDQSGAETLLGAGDMLFSDRGAAPRRLHGCYVDEEEIHRVVEFVKTQGRAVYNLDILKPRDDEDGDGNGAPANDEPADEMYDQAVRIVAETRQASISMIQRRLRVGYNRAARMVELMEKQGIVGPPDVTNKREVLVSAA